MAVQLVSLAPRLGFVAFLAFSSCDGGALGTGGSRSQVAPTASAVRFHPAEPAILVPQREDPTETPQRDDPAIAPSAAASASLPPLSSREREVALKTASPNVARWRVVSDAMEPSGYVCFFYSVPPSYDCRSRDVRVVARYRRHGKASSDCPTVATLYWAPNRIPGRPERDSTGTIDFESDGVAFRYTEIDDYVAELTGCAPLSKESLRDARSWAAALGRLLGR